MLDLIWHVEYNPVIDYDKSIGVVYTLFLPTFQGPSDYVKFQNLVVKKFRYLLRKTKENTGNL